MVMMSSVAAAARAASASTRRKAGTSRMSWSAVRMAATAFSPPRRSTTPQAVATAAAVSRRHGSATMFARGSSGNSRRVAFMSEPAVMMRMRSNGTSPFKRSTAWRMRDFPPKTLRNCLGRSGVESGQKRSPLPPERMTA